MSSFPHEKTSPSSATSKDALAGLNPMGLMDAAITEDCHDWEPPQPEALEPVMPGFKDFSFIDRGGMGAVYKATQVSLSRTVAIKILAPELSDDPAFMRLFEREGQMLGRLQHPQIVTVYESGRTAAGHLYLVMEYVHGKSLLDHLAVKRPTLTHALDYTAQVCDALIYAHERGVMHLDIKPGNILIDERNLVRVADFGLSRGLQFEDSGATSRLSHAFLGTLGYAAPEQKKKAGIVDHRADIYSLGVTLYEMLTGQLPVGVFAMPSKNGYAPSHVDTIITRALSQKPEDRFSTAKEMRQAIAKSMLRLGTPLVQRAIISRPIVAMVTCLMVGMGFIYLIDALSRELGLTNRAAVTSSRTDTPTGVGLTPLDANWGVTQQSLIWGQLQSILLANPDWELAEIHSEAEQQHLAGLLKLQKITTPLWLGARLQPRAVPFSFEWFSGKKADFKILMPERGRRPIIITEIQAKNNKTLKAKDGQFPDWIEVHNPSTEPVDLTGYSLRHDYSDLKTVQSVKQIWLSAASLPEDSSMILQPGEYRVITFSFKQIRQPSMMHLNFRLEAYSGRLQFFDPQGLACQIFMKSWSEFPEDASLGLAPDGQSWGWCQIPTPGAANSAITTPFPAPSTNGQPKSGLVMLPEFDCRWSRCAISVPNRALLKRKEKKGL